MDIVVTIVPIFGVIFVGWVAHLKGFISPDFIGPANRLVYYIAIPALVFRAISKASLHSRFNLSVVLCTLFSMLLIFLVSWLIGAKLCRERNRKGTFVQSSLHGNVGYIGLAVAFYYLGDEGLSRASILSGFVMLLQNFLAVFILHYYSVEDVEYGNGKRLHVVKAIALNPVVISAILGIFFSAFEIPLPLVISRILDIVASLALPMALLVIGASLTFEQMRNDIFTALTSSGIKLIILPAAGILCFRMLQIPAREYLPALIVLSTPTATVSYVMAREMGGDPDFAVSAISLCTLFSALTMAFWLRMGG